MHKQLLLNLTVTDVVIREKEIQGMFPYYKKCTYFFEACCFLKSPINLPVEAVFSNST